MKKFFLLFILLTAPLSAQDKNSRGDFFEKDFVTGSKKNDDKNTPGISDKSDASKEGQITIEGEFGEKVLALGVLVDIYDQKHLDKVMDNYYKIIRESRLFPAPIYLHGINDIIYSNPRFIEFITMGANFTSVFSLPKPYGIKNSPTWIISLERGQILIEGLMDIDKYIQKGMFYEKMIPDYQQKKEIEQKPQAF